MLEHKKDGRHPKMSAATHTDTDEGGWLLPVGLVGMRLRIGGLVGLVWILRAELENLVAVNVVAKWRLRTILVAV